MKKPDSKVDAFAQCWLKEYPAGELNAADFLCDRHARIPDRVALSCRSSRLLAPTL